MGSLQMYQIFIHLNGDGEGRGARCTGDIWRHAECIHTFEERFVYYHYPNMSILKTEKQTTDFIIFMSFKVLGNLINYVFKALRREMPRQTVSKGR